MLHALLALRSAPGAQKIKIMRFRSGNLCYHEREDGFKDMVVIVGQVGDDYWITINPETLAELQSVSADKLSPVPINQFNLGLLGIKEDGEHYITNVGIVDYKVIHCNDEWWEFRHYFTNTHATVRYIHEVQNLIDVLKDF